MLVSGMLFHATQAAAACSVLNSTTPRVREIVGQQGGWPISNAKCEFLKKNNLYLNVKAESTVLAGSSVGWAVVSLVSEDNVASDETHSSTYVNSSVASMDRANQLTITALKDAINGLDFEKAAGEITAYRKSMKKS